MWIVRLIGCPNVELRKGIFANGGELAWKGGSIDAVQTHFFKDYLQTWQSGELTGGVSKWTLGGVVTPIAISLAAIWLLMYLCIFRGVRLVSKVVLLTVPLPWIMLLILTVRGLTLPGAARGLNFYLDPNWSELAKPQTWRWAFGQMFFSMSLAFGVMVTYASFLHRKSDINNNATIIGLADIGTSFVAGIAVFATLGAMAYASQEAGSPVAVTKVVSKGLMLAFVAFPYALAQLPASAWFGAVFFIALLTLGIDSAFSITESVLASLVDKTRWSRDVVLLGMTIFGFGLGLFYCTRGGLEWIDAIDTFINEWGGIALLGLLECVVVGWAYRLKRLREHANERSDWRIGWWWDVVIRYVAPLLLSALAAWSLLDQAWSKGGLLYDQNGVFQTPRAVGLMIGALAPLLALALSAIRSPGADTHAQHVGQRRAGRGWGVVASILVLAGVAVLVCAFTEAIWAQWALENKKAIRSVTMCGLSTSVPGLMAMAGGVLGLIGVVIGAAVVAFGERNARRPSGFARLGAGAGVVTVGCSAGLLLALFVLAGGAVKGAGEQRREVDQLTTSSYIVLSVMLGIIVVGLGWCFYRAVRAAGAEETAQKQLSEGMDNSR